jgi:glycosidase
VKLALLLLLTLRGTPFLYQGDEIGLVDGPVQREDVLDAVGARFWPVYKGRDAERTPMPWNGEPGGGFTPAGVRPWLPMAEPALCNVTAQEGEPASPLELCRRTIAARHASEDLAVGSYRTLPSPDGTWAYARGDGTTVLLNMSSETVSFAGVAGTVTVSTEHGLEGQGVEDALALPPWGGAVVRA